MLSVSTRPKQIRRQLSSIRLSIQRLRRAALTSTPIAARTSGGKSPQAAANRATSGASGGFAESAPPFAPLFFGWRVFFGVFRLGSDPIGVT
jgi:hypothetical protein